MNFITALMTYGWMMTGNADGMPSRQRENRKKRFSREKKIQRLARRINR